MTQGHHGGSSARPARRRTSARPRLMPLEDRAVPSTTNPLEGDVPVAPTSTTPAVVTPIVAVGAEAGNLPYVKVINATNGETQLEFLAYEHKFRGGVRVATGDVNGDGRLDIITAPGIGGGPLVKVWDSSSGEMLGAFIAYHPSFRGGMYVASKDVNGDGFSDIVTGAGEGGGPHVRVFNGAWVCPPVMIATPPAGPIVVEDQPVPPPVEPPAEEPTTPVEEPTTPGEEPTEPGEEPTTPVEEPTTPEEPPAEPPVEPPVEPTVVPPPIDTTTQLLHDFMAYDMRFFGGVRVAAGDVDGDGKADIITGAGIGGGPHVRVFDSTTGQVYREFMAFSSVFTGGVYVTAGDIDGDRRAEIAVGSGSRGGAQVNLYRSFSGLLMRSIAIDPGRPTASVRVHMVDFDNDGQTDLLAGIGRDMQVRDPRTGGLKSSTQPLDDRFTDGLNLG